MARGARVQVIDRARGNIHSPANAQVTVFDNTDLEKAATTGVPVWQQVGVEVPNEVIDGRTALERGDALWKVKKVESYAKIGDNYVLDKGGFKLVREDTGAIVGSHVGKKYTTVQNEEAIKVLDPIVQSGMASYDSVGVVFGGEIVWTMLKLKDELVLPGNDRVMKYLMFLNSHNGAFSLRIFPAPLRAWCANVLNSLSRYFTEGVSIRHTISADARLNEAKKIIEKTEGFYKEFGVQALKLASARMTDAQVKAMVEFIFPSREEKDTGKEEITTRTKNMREKVLGLYEGGAGHSNIKGTAWAAWNAVTEYADHHRPTRTVGDALPEESKFNSVMFGTGQQLKGKALSWIEENVLAA